MSSVYVKMFPIAQNPELVLQIAQEADKEINRLWKIIGEQELVVRNQRAALDKLSGKNHKLANAFVSALRAMRSLSEEVTRDDAQPPGGPH